jgi:hypothetical protein
MLLAALVGFGGALLLVGLAVRGRRMQVQKDKSD